MYVTAIVPTFRRPEYLLRALASLAAQTRPVDEIIVVARVDDGDSRAAFATAASLGHARAPRLVLVGEAGHLPPLVAARQALGPDTDVVLIMDDDATAEPDALARLLVHYADASVAAAGGRIIEYFGGRRHDQGVATEFGVVRWNGLFWGGFELDAPDEKSRDVQFLRGAWMSFRRRVFDRLIFRAALNRNVATHYEVDLGLQTRALGGRVIYEPTSRVRHFNAPRLHGSQRSGQDARRTRAIAHNMTLLQLEHLRGARRWCAIAFNVLVGDIDNWGVLRLIADPLLHRRWLWRGQLLASYAGKLDAVRSFSRDRARLAGPLRNAR